MNNSKITIRFAGSNDLAEIQTLFVETIEAVCKKDYLPEQIKAWTSSVENTQRWIDKIKKQYFLIAQIDNKIVGYASLENKAYLDLMYIHKDFQRQGIAYRLYADIEKEAKRQRQTVLTADVSKTAKPFFEKMGFKILTGQTVVRNGVELSNYKMKKELIIIEKD